jgi:hypothetical protein
MNLCMHLTVSVKQLDNKDNIEWIAYHKDLLDTFDTPYISLAQLQTPRTE